MREGARQLGIALVALALLHAGGTLLGLIAPDAVWDIPDDNDLYPAEETGTPPLPQEAPVGTGVRVPILVYHIVRPSFASDDADIRALAQTPDVFDAQMAHLRDAGYHVIPLSTLDAALSASSTPSLPDKPIVLTLDDGWTNQYQFAFPILKKYGYTATFFVFTNSIGQKGFLTWDNLREMLSAGMTIGSHSRTHPYLTKIVVEETLKNEIEGSKRTLEDNLHIPVTEFAYPFGQFNPHIVDLVKAAGYVSARGDFYYGWNQTAGRLYSLSALNAPTTTAKFNLQFP